MPHVVAVADADSSESAPGFLVLEYIEPGPRIAHFDELLGRGLADLHCLGAPSFGLDHAVYGGHREVDLAMMRLFGGFGSRVFDAYEEARPLASGAAARIPLHQLYPLLVHLNHLAPATRARSLERSSSPWRRPDEPYALVPRRGCAL